MAGGIFFLLNRPTGTGVTIILSSPTAAVSSDDATDPQATTDARTDINSASAVELMALPGIGEVRSQAIVDYRTREGPFQRTDELMRVPGIGAGIYERVRELVTVGAVP